MRTSTLWLNASLTLPCTESISSTTFLGIVSACANIVLATSNKIPIDEKGPGSFLRFFSLFKIYISELYRFCNEQYGKELTSDFQY